MKKSFTSPILFFVLAFNILFTPYADATLIFETFRQPGDQFNTNQAYAVSGPDHEHPLFIDEEFDQASRFTVSGNDYYFSTAELALDPVFGVNLLDVFLMADMGGMPGSIIESVRISNVPDSLTIVEVLFSSMTILSEGTSYWLGASAPDDAFFIWALSDGIIGFNTVSASQLNGGGWMVRPERVFAPAFRISGTSIPEPATLALFSLGLAGLGFSRRKYARFNPYALKGKP